MKKNSILSLIITVTLLISLIQTLVNGQTGPQQWFTLTQRPGASVSFASGAHPREANNDVKVLSSGNVIAVGSAYGTGTPTAYNDAAIRKYRGTDGALLNAVYVDRYFGQYDDKAVKVVVKEPYIYVLMTSQYNLAPFDNDIIIRKYDTSLVFVWDYTFNGAGDANDVAVDMGMDVSGNLYVIGNTSRSGTGNDLVWIKLNENGGMLLTKYYSSTGNFNDYANAMFVEPNGICSVTGSYGSSAYGQRLVVLKLWGNGVKLWEKYHDALSSSTLEDEGTHLAIDPITSDVYVSGRGRTSTTGYDWIMVKFAGADGTKLWSKKFAGTGTSDDFGGGIAYAGSGFVYGCGTITTAISGVTSKNIQLKKINGADGVVAYTKTFNYVNNAWGGSEEKAFNMILTPAENVYIFGTCEVPNPTYYAANQLIIGYNSGGTVLWYHLQSASSTSSFQTMHATCGVFSSALNSLYVGGFKTITMSFGYEASLMKFTPVSFAQQAVAKEAEMSNSISGVKVFPNPTTDYLLISVGEDMEYMAEIFDIAGKSVNRQAIQGTENRIDVSELTPGHYILRLTGNGNAAVHRFVKQ